MNDIQIFNNEEFGEIRTVVSDDGIWFVGKDISEKLGYVKTANMLKRIDEDDRKVVSSDILSSGSKREPQVYKQRYQITIINESGLYAAIFGSTLPNSKKFKKWVTSEVLPSIRKTGSYSVNRLPVTPSEQIKLLAQGHVELEKRVDAVAENVENVKNDLETFKMDLPILPIEADRITAAVRSKGVSVLGGKDSVAYQDRSIRQKVYNNLYSNLKYNFGVRSYKSIRRNQCEKAISIIQQYQPPFLLAELIDNTNAQMELDL